MEVGGMLLDVSGERDEVLVDKPGSLIVLIRFGFQPNAAASTWGGAEIDQHGFFAGLRFRESSICVF